MIPRFLPPILAALSCTALALPVAAASITLNFTAEKTQEQVGHAIGGYDGNGDPILYEFGAFKDSALGTTYAGSFTVSGSDADLLALAITGHGEGLDGSGVTVGCTIGFLVCPSGYSNVGLGLFSAQAELYDMLLEDTYTFDFGLAGSSFRLVDIESYLLAPGENDYDVSFRLFDFSLDISPDVLASRMNLASLSLTPVPVPAALPLAVLGLGALGWAGRRRRG